MRAWQLDSNFGLENLRPNEIIQEELKANQVRVQIRACSLNYRDLMVVKGQYDPNLRFPLIPLSDGAGQVVEVGDAVTELKVGDRVCATFSQKWCHGIATAETMKNTLGSPLQGTLAEFRVFNEEGLIKFPEFLSFEEAATLPCAAVTAFNAIAFQSGLSPGDTVLLEGTGGVSLFALQFAKAFGLDVIILSSSDEKLARAKSMGALHCINYRQHEDWPSAILDLTKGKGVDAVIEVGGAKTLERAARSVKKGGVICLIGVLSGAREPLDLRPILMNNVRIQGIFVGAKTIFSAMNRVVLHGKIRPVIDTVFGFEEAKNAFTHLESGKHFGKVCIKV